MGGLTHKVVVIDEEDSPTPLDDFPWPGFVDSLNCCQREVDEEAGPDIGGLQADRTPVSSNHLVNHPQPETGPLVFLFLGREVGLEDFRLVFPRNSRSVVLDPDFQQHRIRLEEADG